MYDNYEEQGWLYKIHHLHDRQLFVLGRDEMHDKEETMTVFDRAIDGIQC